MSRAVLHSFLLALLALLIADVTPALADDPPAPNATVIEQEPPEEDPALQPQQYTFNPLEADRNITAGNFYYKKGNYRAASRRFLEATKWDPTSGSAQLKLAAAYEKMRNYEGAREAYGKFLEIDPENKDAAKIKKKMDSLPKPPGTPKSAESTSTKPSTK